MYLYYEYYMIINNLEYLDNLNHSFFFFLTEKKTTNNINVSFETINDLLIMTDKDALIYKYIIIVIQ